MKRFASLLLVLVAFAAVARGQLKEGDFVAVCGDSITEQKQYSVFIEDYLLMCRPVPNLRTMQFGWSGEVAPGFLSKMPNEALKFQMTVATTAYGMNDGRYKPLEEKTANDYRNGMTGIVQAFKKHGVRFIVVGSPGCVDSDTYKKNPELATMYNKTLAGLRDIAKEVAEKEGVTFANVFDTMTSAMQKAKAKYGPAYHVAGGDGVHPGANGQLCMAYAFLKALGVDGNIGTITVDLAKNGAEATDGHKVLSAKDGEVQIESTRYPFCFFGDPASPGSTSGIIEFLPFNQDLNRLTLKVIGATGKVKVTWGKTTKEYEAADLAKGINLAADFIDNPFCDAFKAVEKAVRAQQNAETPLVKKTLHDLPKSKNKEADEKAAQDQIANAKKLFGEAAASVKPVTHTIKIEVVK